MRNKRDAYVILGLSGVLRPVERINRSNMKWIIYLVYNIAWLKVVTFLLGYLHTYINGILIPNSFRWGANNKLKENLALYGICQYIISNIEVVMLLVPLYPINKWYLSANTRIESETKVSTWTMIICLAILCIWVFRLYYLIYK